MIDRIRGEIRATPAVVEVQAPSGGFDWGDAGIGAAGMLALFTIAGGAALLTAGRRRGEGSARLPVEPGRGSTRDGHLEGGGFDGAALARFRIPQTGDTFATDS
jgi:hypothetical protein